MDLLGNALFVFNACIIVVRSQEVAVSCIMANVMIPLPRGDDIVKPFYTACDLAKERRMGRDILTSP